MRESKVTTQLTEVLSEATLSMKQVRRFLWQRLQELFDYFQERDIWDENQTSLYRIETNIEDVEPLAWLQKQPHATKMFWSDRDGSFAMGGIDQADQILWDQSIPRNEPGEAFKKLQAILENCPKNIRYYGGMRFDASRQAAPEWEAFGTYHFVVPRFEIRVQPQGTTFACNFRVDFAKDLKMQCKALQKELGTLDFQTGERHFDHLPQCTEKTNTPNQEEWIQCLESVLPLLEQKALEKVVLARKSTFQFERSLEPTTLLQRLRQTTPHSFFFLFQPKFGTAFIGGSPERLYKRSGNVLESEALAGTRPRGENPQEDQDLEFALLQSEKEVHEHKLVLDAIQSQFEQFCQQVETESTLGILKLKNVQHIRSQLKGILQDANDAQLLKALHPTPAVGGTPRQEAMHLLAECEPFDRGWYAAPIGWFSAEDAEFAVAIRSGLIREKQLSLYSGAGIVEGSKPQAEWFEIERKIEHFVALFLQQ